MFREKIIAKRYAEAFLGYAREGSGFAKGLEDLLSFKALLRDVPELKRFLLSPELSSAEKAAMIDRLVTNGYSKELRDFLKLLLEKGRINKFEDIAEYARLTYAHAGEIEVVLNTTYPLDTDLIQAIKDKLAVKLNKKIKLYIKLNPDLLGGVQVVFGNKSIDGSVRHRLDEMKARLLAVRVS